MSHVASVAIEIKSLDALEAACKRIGLTLVRGQKTYKWYGESVGDYPLPEGFTEEQLGTCDHALKVADKPGAYEVGVCKNPNGEGFVLLWDFWSRGYGLQDIVGEECNTLKQAYATEAAIEQARAEGYMVDETVLKDGSIELTLTGGPLTMQQGGM